MKKKTTVEFIADCIAVHGDKYDYSNTIYDGAHKKVMVSCHLHGSFESYATNHIRGGECPTCAQTQRPITKSHKHEEIITLARSIHGDIYDYSKMVYVKMKTPVTIVCKLHGDFNQTMNNHLYSNNGCPRCAPALISKNKSHTTGDIIELCKKVHGDLYDYSKVKYSGYKHPIIIGCKTHGFFEQAPDCHISQKQGCPTCGRKYHIKENLWLDSHGLHPSERQIWVTLYDGSKIRADGMRNNVIYEFWGDFWHGNPDVYNPDDMNLVSKRTFRELYESTLLKIEKIKKSGFKLVDIWEADYDLIQ